MLRNDLARSARRRLIRMNAGRFSLTKRVVNVAFAVALVLALASAADAQTLAANTNPPTGVAGTNDSYITGSGFPSGTLTPATVSFAATCGGTVVATTAVTQVANEPPFKRFEFLIPSSLKTGTYYVTVSGPGYNTASTPSCSAISVTATSTTIAACVPTSSLAVTAGTNVNAYVPSGYWDGGDPGIALVPIEGTSTATTFTTTGDVNSCASNSVTGEVVCTENTTNVDLINGSTLTTLTSGANTYAEFTGGACENCGVAVNAANNTAIIAEGYTGGAEGIFGGESGVQVLNLSNNTFNAPFGLTNYVSEDISIDSGRNLVLSPGEGGVYDLLQIGSGNSLTEFGNDVGPGGYYSGYTLDSAAEDCTTGIAMSSNEFTDNIYMTDLTQASFTSGSPGTWTAPGQYVELDDDGYSAGTSGISEAPGGNHLGVVTGEFGGAEYSALELPSTSGSGTPTLADWAYVESMPNTPNGYGFSAGYDPHTVAAYTSPNTGKSYAVFADYADYTTHPSYIAVVDLACVLALPRSSAHIVASPSTATAACTNYIPVP
jgi:hypothetical protein